MKGREPPSEPSQTPARTIDNTGSCSCCNKNVKLDDGKAVDHGFQVAGGRQGSCFGVGRPPIEVSPQGAIDFIAHLEQKHESRTSYLTRLETTEVEQVSDFSAWPPKTYKRGEKGFDVALRSAIAHAKQEIGSIESWLRMFRRKVADWTPKPLPDGKRDHMPSDTSEPTTDAETAAARM